MSNGLKVKTGEMYENGNQTVRDAGEFNEKINDLKSHKDSLMDIWRGPAANEFGTQVESQITNLNEFRDLLNEFGEKIMRGAQTFEDNENDAVARAQRLYD